MEELRVEIDEIDKHLVELLGRRFTAVRSVGLYKKEQGIQVLQAARWDEVLSRVIELAQDNSLSEDMIVIIWNTIHEFAKIKEKEILNTK